MSFHSSDNPVNLALTFPIDVKIGPHVIIGTDDTSGAGCRAILSCPLIKNMKKLAVKTNLDLVKAFYLDEDECSPISIYCNGEVTLVSINCKTSINNFNIISHALITWLINSNVNKVEIIAAVQMKLSHMNLSSSIFVIPIENYDHESNIKISHSLIDHLSFSLEDAFITSLINFLIVSQIESAVILIRGYKFTGQKDDGATECVEKLINTSADLLNINHYKLKKFNFHQTPNIKPFGFMYS